MSPQLPRRQSDPQFVAEMERRGLESEQIPYHVAIILDGNGRWAKQRGLSRSEGHRAGAARIDSLFEEFLLYRIPCLSLYVFSTENWKRPALEVSSLWKLMDEYFRRRFDYCRKHDIRVVVSGSREGLPPFVAALIDEVESRTRDHNSLVANFCLNYGSQSELAHAASSIVRERLAQAASGNRKVAEAPVSIDEMAQHLLTHPLPPVDLLIRPGGEYRISNFLLWQSAYAELYFTDRLWPDFDADELQRALAWYQGRERRFGDVGTGSSEQAAATTQNKTLNQTPNSVSEAHRP